MGGLCARGVDEGRVASIEHTFKPPGSGSEYASGGGDDDGGSTTAPPPPTASSATGQRGGGGGSRRTAVVGPPPSADSKGVAEIDDIVGIEDNDGAASREETAGGGARLGILGMMASALKETDPEEGAALEGLARKLIGRQYFLDPRVFNLSQVNVCIAV